MNAVELEQYLTQFLQQCRDAKFQYEQAVALEQYPNDAIQDILHTLEFAPWTLENADIATMLHDFRVQRRDTKKELEVTTIFYDWATQNKKSIDLLEQALGAMRKVLRRQPNDAYRFKSNAIGEKGSWLNTEEPKTLDENQITLFDIMKEEENGD